MILPAGFAAAIPGLCLGVAGLTGVAWYWTARKSNLRRALFSLGILGALVLALNSCDIGTPIVIVRSTTKGGPMESTRGRLVFAETYHFGNGKTAQLAPLTGENELFGTTIVNDSPTPMRLDAITYAANSALAIPNYSSPVAPMSVREIGTQVDDIGPGEAPPNEMTSPISMSARIWLTWGDSDSSYKFLVDDAGTETK